MVYAAILSCDIYFARDKKLYTFTHDILKVI